MKFLGYLFLLCFKRSKKFCFLINHLLKQLSDDQALSKQMISRKQVLFFVNPRHMCIHWCRSQNVPLICADISWNTLVKTHVKYIFRFSKVYIDPTYQSYILSSHLAFCGKSGKGLYRRKLFFELMNDHFRSIEKMFYNNDVVKQGVTRVLLGPVNGLFPIEFTKAFS